jgi:hypothetical protein
MKHLFLPVMLLACSPVVVRAQMVMAAKTPIEAEMQRGTSGTSAEPASTPIAGPMGSSRGWTLMLHSNAFVGNAQQQAAGERGRDAFFSTSWIMPMAQHKLGPGVITLRTMFSLEPGTIGGRNYPELFQQGETAYGTPIVDGQHPHDFFMEVGAAYDVPVSKSALLSLYAAPIGDPAIGPTAYPHRQSASEDPIAALGHHQEDSTHIAFNVVTGGVTYKWVRVELSGFHGGEPDEHRWAFQPSPNGHAMDSVATRLTVSPTADWTGQYSIAHIHSPEALYPGEDQQRQTASVMYHHTFSRQAMPKMAMPGMKMDGVKMDDMGGMNMSDMPGMDMKSAPAMKMDSGAPAMTMEADPKTDLSATAVWGRTRSLTDNSKENSYLAEGLLRFATKNYVWTRLENAGRSNELLLTPGTALPPGFAESPIGHVAAFTVGYDHDFAIGPHLVAAPGAQFTVYRTPGALKATYGDTPTGEVVFVRFRLR